MSNQVKDLTSDQLRRIFRDYLTGRPKEKLMKKYDITEEVFWEIVGMYSKKKHPNDVGNAQDIQGPADLLVSPLDTGSTATENAIVARNPEDLLVSREQVVQEFDYNSPEEELRKKGGEVNDLIRDRTSKTAEDQRNEAREVIKANKEATDAILEDLTQVSEAEKADLTDEAAERAKATPSPEEALKQRNEEAEGVRRQEIASELLREETTIREAKEAAEKWPALVEAGKKQNEESAKREQEARLREQNQRLQEAKDVKQSSEGAAPGSDLGVGSGPSAGSDTGASSDPNDQPANKGAADGQGGGNSPANGEAGGDAKVGEGGAVNPANTSPGDQSKPTEPAKVMPEGLAEKK